MAMTTTTETMTTHTCNDHIVYILKLRERLRNSSREVIDESQKIRLLDTCHFLMSIN